MKENLGEGAGRIPGRGLMANTGDVQARYKEIVEKIIDKDPKLWQDNYLKVQKRTVLKARVRDQIQKEVQEATKARNRFWNKRLTDAQKADILKTRTFIEKIKGTDLLTKLVSLGMVVSAAKAYYDDGWKGLAVTVGTQVAVLYIIKRFGPRLVEVASSWLGTAATATLLGFLNVVLLPKLVYDIAEGSVYLGLNIFILDPLRDENVKRYYSDEGSAFPWNFWVYPPNKGYSRKTIFLKYHNEDELRQSLVGWHRWVLEEYGIERWSMRDQKTFEEIAAIAMDDLEKGMKNLEIQTEKEMNGIREEDVAELERIMTDEMKAPDSGEEKEAEPTVLIAYTLTEPEKPRKGDKVSIITKGIVFGLPGQSFTADVENKINGPASPRISDPKGSGIFNFDENNRVGIIVVKSSFTVEKPGNYYYTGRISVEGYSSREESGSFEVEDEEKDDAYEKAQRELEKAKVSEQLSVQAGNSSREALNSANQAFEQVNNAANQIKDLLESAASAEKTCADANKSLLEVKASSRAAHNEFMGMSSCYAISKNRWREACDAAAQLKNIRNMTKAEIDLLESRAGAAAKEVRVAADECEKRADLVEVWSGKTRTANQKVKELLTGIEEISSKISSIRGSIDKLDGLAASAAGQVENMKNKSSEAAGFAADVEGSRDKIVEILKAYKMEERAKQMIQTAESASAIARKAANDTRANISNAVSIIKKTQDRMASLRADKANLAKIRRCDVQSGDTFVKDAQASKDTADVFAGGSAEYARSADLCARFIGKVDQSRTCSLNERWDESIKRCICKEGYENLNNKCVLKGSSDISQDGRGGSGYDPAKDPNFRAGSKPPVDPNIGDSFQNQQPGSKPDGRDGRGSRDSVPQPGSYTQPAGGEKTPEGDKQPTDYAPAYPPYGPPQRDRIKGKDWTEWARDIPKPPSKPKPDKQPPVQKPPEKPAKPPSQPPAKPLPPKDTGTGGLTDVVVNSQNITISVWDHATVDNDIIDIRLNGKTIPGGGGVVLTKTPKVFNLKLGSGQNIIEIYAVNEGTLSPNTASIKISNVTSGKAEQVYRINQKTSARFSAAVR